VALLSKKAKIFENDIKEKNHGADTHPNKRQGIIKALIFMVFVISAIVLIRFTPTKNYITIGVLTAFLENAGVWAPVAYIIIHAVGVCLFLPGTLLTALGAAIFGAYWGFVYVWIAAMLGSSGAFLIGRTLAREFAASLNFTCAWCIFPSRP
jgi:uncharacterized membrane protein YdjX (TVP38/TMEM64 family)